MPVHIAKKKTPLAVLVVQTIISLPLKTFATFSYDWSMLTASAR